MCLPGMRLELRLMCRHLGAAWTQLTLGQQLHRSACPGEPYIAQPLFGNYAPQRGQTKCCFSPARVRHLSADSVSAAE